MVSFLTLLLYILKIYSWILLAYVIIGMLIAFGVINPYNKAVNIIYDALTRLTEPLLKPIRKLLPDTGALDLAPLVLFLLIWFLQMLIAEYGPALVGAVQS